MWRDVPGFPNVQVTATGRVRIVPHVLTVRRGASVFQRRNKGGELSPTIGSRGYPVVGLRDPDPNSKHRYGRRPFAVHILVCRAFHGEPPPGRPYALHRNDVKSDIHPGNLYWGSTADNFADRISNGITPRGEKHHKTTITEEEVRSIRSRHRPGCPTNGGTALAREYGVDRTTIWNILTGKTWKHVD